MKPSYLVRAALILMILGMSALYVFWFPEAADYLTPTEAPHGWPVFLRIAGTCLLALLTGVMVAGFYFPIAIERDRIFTRTTAVMLNVCACLIGAACLLMLTVCVMLLCRREFLLSPPLCFVALLGFVVTAFLFILSGYVKKASALREEAEGTL